MDGVRIHDPAAILNFNMEIDAFCGAFWRRTIKHQVNQLELK